MQLQLCLPEFTFVLLHLCEVENSPQADAFCNMNEI
jgi:hypothetical protein